ncbi:conjugal transfer protein, partial [mine drainage metagenome]
GRAAGVRTVILDPLGEFSGLAEALGGAVVRLGADARVRLNPLDPVTTGGDRKEKAGRVGAILRALFPSLLDEETAALDASVTRLYERGPEVPTMGDLVDLIAADPKAPPRLAGLLEVFRSGSLAAVDGPTTIDPRAEVLTVDFRGIPENHLPFHLAYVLDWTYGL